MLMCGSGFIKEKLCVYSSDSYHLVLIVRNARIWKLQCGSGSKIIRFFTALSPAPKHWLKLFSFRNTLQIQETPIIQFLILGKGQMNCVAEPRNFFAVFWSPATRKIRNIFPAVSSACLYVKNEAIIKIPAIYNFALNFLHMKGSSQSIRLDHFTKIYCRHIINCL
jgi:hypothetical protein